MTRVRGKSVNLSPKAYFYLTHCPRLVRLLEPATHDPYLRTLKGCAELSTRVLFHNLARQAKDAGLLHLVRADLLAKADFEPRPPSTPPVAEGPEDSGRGSG